MVTHSAFTKNILREIRGSLGRYIAIVAIIALGSGFFTGLRACKPSMLITADEYLREHALFDFRILSTLGFNDDDVASLAGLDGVMAAQGAVYADVLCTSGSNGEYVLTAHSITHDVNTLSLTLGRLPESPDECVLDARHFDSSVIGTSVSLSASNSEDTLELFKYDQYTVVGLADSPYYLNYQRGNTSLGDGSVAAFVYIPYDGFDCDIYYEIFVSFGYLGSIYSDEYKDAAASFEEAVTLLAENRSDLRYLTVASEAREELDDGWADYYDAMVEYDDAKAGTDREFTDAWLKLLDSKQALDDGGAQLEGGWAALQTQTAEARKTLEEAEAELAAALMSLEDGEAEYESGLARYETGLSGYEQGVRDYEEGLFLYESGLAEYEAALEQYRLAGLDLDSAYASLMSGEAQYAQMDALYASVSAIAAATSAVTGTSDPDRFIDYVQALLPAAASGDPAAAMVISLIDASLAAYGTDTAGLVAAWNEAGASLDVAGYGGVLGPAVLASMRAALDAGWLGYADGCDQYSAAGLELRQAKEKLDESAGELESTEKQLADVRAELDEAVSELDSARSKLDSGWAEYHDGIAGLDAGWADLNSLIDSASGRLSESGDGLADGQTQYDDGLEEYFSSRIEANLELQDARTELEDAQAELLDAESDLAALEHPSTYVLGRETNAGYVYFENDSQIVHAISTVFPLFFFLVAALVCITTMTRMVDEQRTQIGTMKALGFSKGSIMLKYLIYSGSASLLGCLIGIVVGSYIFPLVIWETYDIMYNSFSEIVYYLDIRLALITLFLYLFCAIGVTWYSCNVELSEVAAELIRPKSPKSGKRIFLERLTFIWRRISFLGKVSARNIFRNKKRMVMMTLGVGGCTALMLTGFGLSDSIKGLVEYQFDEITLYDYSVTFSEAQDEQSQAAFIDENGSGISQCLFVHESTVDAYTTGNVKSSYLIVSDTGEIENFISLHSDGETLPYPGSGEALISISLAQTFSLEPGDTIKLRTSDLKDLELTVSGVFSNYVFNYIYISADTCLQQWGFVPDFKTAYVNAGSGADVYASAAQAMGSDGVGGVSINADTREVVTTMLDSLNYIVLLVLLCAGALAFIVLYNLTNINITERLREIATIKVLGFYPLETAAYVFRENFVLTVFGAGLGLALGIWLHSFVMAQIKIDMMYFPVNIAGVSFVWSVLLTFAFALVVDFLMYFKINAINMTEALKSIE